MTNPGACARVLWRMVGGAGALALLLGLLGADVRPARADESPAPTLRLQWQPPPMTTSPAALQGPATGQPSASEDERPVTSRWWFWAAVGGVVATTVIVLVLANKEESAPETTLGNMEGFRGK